MTCFRADNSLLSACDTFRAQSAHLANSNPSNTVAEAKAKAEAEVVAIQSRNLSCSQSDQWYHDLRVAAQ